MQERCKTALGYILFGNTGKRHLLQKTQTGAAFSQFFFHQNIFARSHHFRKAALHKQCDRWVIRCDIIKKRMYAAASGTLAQTQQCLPSVSPAPVWRIYNYIRKIYLSFFIKVVCGFPQKSAILLNISVKMPVVMTSHPSIIPAFPLLFRKRDRSAPCVIVRHGICITQQLFPEPQILNFGLIQLDH